MKGSTDTHGLREMAQRPGYKIWWCGDTRSLDLGCAKRGSVSEVKSERLWGKRGAQGIPGPARTGVSQASKPRLTGYARTVTTPPSRITIYGINVLLDNGQKRRCMRYNQSATLLIFLYLQPVRHINSRHSIGTPFVFTNISVLLRK